MRIIETTLTMSASDAIGTLTHGYRCVGISAGQFSMLDVLDALIDRAGTGGDVTLVSWTIARTAIARVAAFVKARRFGRLRIVLDRSFPGRWPAYVAALIDAVGNDVLRVTRTHAKFGLLAVGDWRLAVRASFNLNPSPRCEQFDIDDSPEIYALFDDWVSKLGVVARPGLASGGMDDFHKLFRAAPAPPTMTVEEMLAAARDGDILARLRR